MIILRRSLLTFAFIFNCIYCFGQEIRNQSLVTILDGEEFDELFDFLIKQNELKKLDKEDVLLYKKKLVAEDTLNIGIYQFGVTGSHSLTFLYVLNKNGKKRFVKNYDTALLLKELLVFFDINEVILSEEHKLSYLSALLQFLNERALRIENRGFIQIE